jgi:hypothetical protein
MTPPLSGWAHGLHCSVCEHRLGRFEITSLGGVTEYEHLVPEIPKKKENEREGSHDARLVSETKYELDTLR